MAWPMELTWAPCMKEHKPALVRGQMLSCLQYCLPRKGSTRNILQISVLSVHASHQRQPADRFMNIEFSGGNTLQSMQLQLPAQAIYLWAPACDTHYTTAVVHVNQLNQAFAV